MNCPPKMRKEGSKARKDQNIKKELIHFYK